MHTSTTPPASGASFPTFRSQLPLATQQQMPQARHAPAMGIRLPQASFPLAPTTGMPAVPDSVPQFIHPPAPASPRSQLCAATRNGDGTVVKRLVQLGYGDLNTIDPVTGKTALMLAAQHGHDDVVLLLCKGATARDLHRSDAQGNSALMLAVAAGNVDVVMLLASMGANIDQEDNTGNTALMQLAAKGQSGMVQRLITAGADPAHRNHAGKTAAELAMAQGHDTMLAALSGTAPSAPASTSANSVIRNAATTTAAPHVFLASSAVASMMPTATDSMGRAIVANDPEALKHLLAALRQSGEDVQHQLARAEKLKTSNPWFADLESTPLMAAAHLGHASLIPVLVAAGAQVDQAMPDGWTALLFAAQQGQTAAVRALLAAGARFDQADSEGETALLFAARNGHTAVVKVLLQAGAAKDNASADGETALMLAAWQGHVDVVQALLRAGANASQSDADGATALMLAARDGHTTTVQLLVQAGVALDQADSDDWTALMFAARQGRREIVTMLLSHGADPDAQNRAGQTARALAHENGHEAVARSLERQRARLSVMTSAPTSSAMPARSPRPAPTTLLEAVESNDAQALKRLLTELGRSGKDVTREASWVGNLKTSNDTWMKGEEMTPLMAAAYFGYKTLLELLTGAGAKVDQPRSDGMTALMWAAQNGRSATLQWLIHAGAKVDLDSRDGTTALMLAAYHGHTAILQALLHAGAKVDQAQTDDKTALMWAARNGDITTVQALLDAGARVNRADSDGWTALMYVAQYGRAATLQALLDAGAKPKLKNRNGNPALTLATSRQLTEIIDLLHAHARTKRKILFFWLMPLVPMSSPAGVGAYTCATHQRCQRKCLLTLDSQPAEQRIDQQRCWWASTRIAVRSWPPWSTSSGPPCMTSFFRKADDARFRRHQPSTRLWFVALSPRLLPLPRTDPRPTVRTRESFLFSSHLRPGLPTG